MSQNDELREQLDAIDYSITKRITTDTPDIDGTLVEMRLSLTERAKTAVIAIIQAREAELIAELGRKISPPQNINMNWYPCAICGFNPKDIEIVLQELKQSREQLLTRKDK